MKTQDTTTTNHDDRVLEGIRTVWTLLSGARALASKVHRHNLDWCDGVVDPSADNAADVACLIDIAIERIKEVVNDADEVRHEIAAMREERILVDRMNLLADRKAMEGALDLPNKPRLADVIALFKLVEDEKSGGV